MIDIQNFRFSRIYSFPLTFLTLSRHCPLTLLVRLAPNGWRYIFVADFGARLFQTTMMLKRATTVDFSTIFGNEIYRLLPPGVLPSSLVNHCLY